MTRQSALMSCAAAAVLASAAALTASPAAAQDTQNRKASTTSELVVTAERRVENLQTTAISATVLDAKALEAKGITGLTALQTAAPGIQISDYSSANTFNMWDPLESTCRHASLSIL